MLLLGTPNKPTNRKEDELSRLALRRGAHVKKCRYVTCQIKTSFHYSPLHRTCEGAPAVIAEPASISSGPQTRACCFCWFPWKSRPCCCCCCCYTHTTRHIEMSRFLYREALEGSRRAGEKERDHILEGRDADTREGQATTPRLLL